jgi:sugar-phosphatase
MPAIQSAIFDMDGLLIDSEPLWYEAAVEVFSPLGIVLTPELYASSIGLRTIEFVDNWFSRYNIDHSLAPDAVARINDFVVDKIRIKGYSMMQVLDLITSRGKIGRQIARTTDQCCCGCWEP